MQTKNDKQTSNVIKYPGKVDIVKNDKIVETLPNVQKIIDKKSHKAAFKNKPNPAAKLNYDRDGNEQKSPEQNLQTYSKFDEIQS